MVLSVHIQSYGSKGYRFVMLSSQRFFRGIARAAMPIDLVLVRNGTSDGTIALKRMRRTKDSFIDPKLFQMHNSRWRLTEFGSLQAKASGKWIRENFKKPFYAHIAGEYFRSLETAAKLGIPDARWVPSIYLRPRDFGSLSNLDSPLSSQEYKEHMSEKARDSFYWTPPNGESIAHLSLRTERVIHWISQHVPPEETALIVTHKDIMETFRIQIEKISQLDYTKMIVQCPPEQQIHHCSILHFTRRNPLTGEVIPTYGWMRVVTPWMGRKFTDNEFVAIVKKRYGNEELLAEISNFPHLYGSSKP